MNGVSVIAALAPGHGALVTQSLPNVPARDRAVELLMHGRDPEAVLAALTAPALNRHRLVPFYSGLGARQYGVVALGSEDEVATYTGNLTLPWSGAATDHGVAVLGNLLRDRAVVDRALESYEGLDCDPPAGLADRLLAALEAGAAAGGDRRCVPELAALSALLVVARPDDPPSDPYLRIEAPFDGSDGLRLRDALYQMAFPRDGTRRENAVTRLRHRYDEWRRSVGLPEAVCRVRTPAGPS